MGDFLEDREGEGEVWGGGEGEGEVEEGGEGGREMEIERGERESVSE